MVDINPTVASDTTTGQFYQFVRRDPPVGIAYGANRLFNPRKCKLVLQSYVGTVAGGLNTNTPHGLLGVAWQANTKDDIVGLTFNSSYQLVLSTAGSGLSGCVYVLYSGTTPTLDNGISPDDVVYQSVFPNNRSATPDNFGNSTPHRALGFDFRCIPFLTQSANDRWRCATATRGGSDVAMPGVIAVAWQGNQVLSNPPDRVAVTIDAAGDVEFTSTAGGWTGWLWVWRARM